MDHRRGITLIETTVWIGVFTFAMLALGNTLLSFYHTNSYAIKESSAIAAAQRGMDAAVRAIRIASYSSNGGYPIAAIDANQFIFYANVTPNDAQIQKVRLYVSGNSLYEGVTEPVGDPPAYTSTESISDLADFVQNIAAATSTFVYYDASGNQVTNYTQYVKVRFVTINLVVDASTSSLPTALTLRSSSALRNLIGN